MRRFYKIACRAVSRLKGRRHVFIITYGRSGSTLLMNLINSADGCCIRGENNAALYDLYRSYAALASASENSAYSKNSHLETSPWFGLSQVSVSRYGKRLAKVFSDEVIRPRMTDCLIGFKEIRHSKNITPDFHGYIKFIQNNFSNAKIVFNHRNLADVSKSKWWASSPNGLNTLMEIEESFNQHVDPGRYFHFYYDTALKDRSHVEELYTFLGIEFVPLKIEDVFSLRHSY